MQFLSNQKGFMTADIENAGIQDGSVQKDVDHQTPIASEVPGACDDTEINSQLSASQPHSVSDLDCRSTCSPDQ